MKFAEQVLLIKIEKLFLQESGCGNQRKTAVGYVVSKCSKNSSKNNVHIANENIFGGLRRGLYGVTVRAPGTTAIH